MLEAPLPHQASLCQGKGVGDVQTCLLEEQRRSPLGTRDETEQREVWAQEEQQGVLKLLPEDLSLAATHSSAAAASGSAAAAADAAKEHRRTRWNTDLGPAEHCIRNIIQTFQL